MKNNIRAVAVHLDAMTGKSWPTAPAEYTVAGEAVEQVIVVPDASGPSFVTITAGRTVKAISQDA